MPEFINLPNFYHDSEILNNVDLPEEDQTLQIQRTLKETEKIQKSVFSLEDSEEIRKRRKQPTIQKKQ
ncbi:MULTISPECIES: hypothetical protein [Enterococcus]|uniref:Uncharacterized protein n=1 Tax=Enterococcus mundtii TaxID=53346 RepID=A0AAI8WD53_ENTMU|nr:hypothetical protein [Enterococcus mundtii]MBE9909921.1 hypothetical protein [Enterococcus mundtii]MCA6773167.1 hypothetical protein [Enterococcus mundtii]QCJ57174.1 hypothetical protein DDJ96_11355 [Enterococcus mundtii]BAO07789.1 hypothetical protein EMQU_2232 [Enterococcus mundtii QU 25]BBM14122.1 uncharacterized protein EM151A_0884 [Enterococcus mundtii]